jgi:hypothetical protein
MKSPEEEQERLKDEQGMQMTSKENTLSPEDKQ